MSDSYWTIDTSLFDGSFRYFGREAVLVRGKVHTEQECYRLSDVNQEITPVGVKEGVRTYLHLRPFVLMPDITLTIGLYPEPRPGGAIGEVVSARELKMKEVEIGNVQAWSYPDGTLVLWECFLREFVRIGQFPRTRIRRLSGAVLNRSWRSSSLGQSGSSQLPMTRCLRWRSTKRFYAYWATSQWQQQPMAKR